MKQLLLLIFLGLSVVASAQTEVQIDDAWKVDSNIASAEDNFWPEQKAQREPVFMNTPGMDIKLQDLRGLRSYDKNQFKSLINKYDDGQVESGKRVYISLEGADASVLGVAAAASLGLIILKGDDDLMDIVQDHKGDNSKKLAAFGYEMGRKEGLLPIVAGSYFLGVIFNNGKLKDIGIISVGAQFAAQMVVEVVKYSTGRERPRAQNGAYSFNVDNGLSFISGHAAGAFSLATLLTEVYGAEHKWVPYLTYGVAAITAWSRMHDEGHWGSDVILGAVAGHIITRIVYRLHKNGDIPEEERNMFVVPYVDQRVEGIPGFERRREEIGLKVVYQFGRPRN